MLRKYIGQKRRRSINTGGFTLLESLVVVGMIGVLSVTAAPSWVTFLERWRLNDAQSQLYSAIRTTQANAQNNRLNWQFSILETHAGEVEWASHPQNELPMVWQTLGNDAIDIDLADTTLDSRDGVYYIRFNYKGNLVSRTRTFTLTSSMAPSIKRCVVMSNLLGAMRQAKEQEKPSSSGRYCY
ncbi:type II secretion system protein [Leptolyngbya cf. ectocarpi LEGE 11479]|uniref:Type II secretion system protein n=1 Tax=Leptolyngbya cf. ectocarpi LEGE 11479 TaxID=1828722 RepID=A0A928ZWA3_LEPEC|nr:type II secretion system protein [Leptolyngbya ectocarpi]MBE9068598.1 type II secretion system protein [Leptolyngbya cf. ectocarpi LEGE 11479]